MPVPWIDQGSGLRPQGVTAPVLELHLLPLDGPKLLGATALAASAKGLSRDARATGFVPDAEPLDTCSSNERAWAVRPPETARQRGHDSFGRTDESFRGLSVTSNGTVTAFLSLPTDLFGTLIDQATVQGHFATMITLLAPHAAGTEEVAIAVRLAPSAKVKEGHVSEMGTRSGGTMSLQEGGQVLIKPTFAVASHSLTNRTGDISAEMTMRLINEVRRIST